MLVARRLNLSGYGSERSPPCPRALSPSDGQERVAGAPDPRSCSSSLLTSSGNHASRSSMSGFLDTILVGSARDDAES
jgi:hypothetical protein